jgi:hypothetical protein
MAEGNILYYIVEVLPNSYQNRTWIHQHIHVELPVCFLSKKGMTASTNKVLP